MTGSSLCPENSPPPHSPRSQGYDPELPILQGPAFHILVKHVFHVIELAPRDGNTGSRELLLAGAGTRDGSVRGWERGRAGGGKKEQGGKREEEWKEGREEGWEEGQEKGGQGGCHAHWMVALSSSISSRSRRASSCSWLRSCCSLVMCSTVFCSVMGLLVCKAACQPQPEAAPPTRPSPRRPRTSFALLDMRLLRVSKAILMLKRLFCSAEMCFICRFCGSHGLLGPPGA